MRPLLFLFFLSSACFASVVPRQTATEDTFLWYASTTDTQHNMRLSRGIFAPGAQYGEDVAAPSIGHYLKEPTVLSDITAYVWAANSPVGALKMLTQRLRRSSGRPPAQVYLVNFRANWAAIDATGLMRKAGHAQDEAYSKWAVADTIPWLQTLGSYTLDVEKLKKASGNREEAKKALNFVCNSEFRSDGTHPVPVSALPLELASTDPKVASKALHQFRMDHMPNVTAAEEEELKKVNWDQDDLKKLLSSDLLQMLRSGKATQRTCRKAVVLTKPTWRKGPRDELRKRQVEEADGQGQERQDQGGPDQEKPDQGEPEQGEPEQGEQDQGLLIPRPYTARTSNRPQRSSGDENKFVSQCSIITNVARAYSEPVKPTIDLCGELGRRGYECYYSDRFYRDGTSDCVSLWRIGSKVVDILPNLAAGECQFFSRFDCRDRDHLFDTGYPGTNLEKFYQGKHFGKIRSFRCSGSELPKPAPIPAPPTVAPPTNSGGPPVKTFEHDPQLNLCAGSHCVEMVATWNKCLNVDKTINDKMTSFNSSMTGFSCNFFAHYNCGGPFALAEVTKDPQNVAKDLAGKISSVQCYPYTGPSPSVRKSSPEDQVENSISLKLCNDANDCREVDVKPNRCEPLGPDQNSPFSSMERVVNRKSPVVYDTQYSQCFFYSDDFCATSSYSVIFDNEKLFMHQSVAFKVERHPDTLSTLSTAQTLDTVTFVGVVGSHTAKRVFCTALNVSKAISLRTYHGTGNKEGSLQLLPEKECYKIPKDLHGKAATRMEAVTKTSSCDLYRGGYCAGDRLYTVNMMSSHDLPSEKELSMLCYPNTDDRERLLFVRTRIEFKNKLSAGTGDNLQMVLTYKRNGGEETVSKAVTIATDPDAGSNTVKKFNLKRLFDDDTTVYKNELINVKLECEKCFTDQIFIEAFDLVITTVNRKFQRIFYPTTWLGHEDKVFYTWGLKDDQWFPLNSNDLIIKDEKEQ